MSKQDLKSRRRSDYVFFQSYRTRWSDNDQYLHVNNSIYYHLFDSVVNAYLIERCGHMPASSSSIGLVVSSFCQFFTPLSYPQLLDLGLRVTDLGKSSVSYEVGVFAATDSPSEATGAVPAAVGGYTHVFVDRDSRRSSPMSVQVRSGLEQLQGETSGEQRHKL